MKRLFSCSLLLLLISPAARTDQLSARVPAETGACQPHPGHGTDANCAPHGWYHIGSGTPGVVARILADPAGSGTIYIGSVGGGVRKSTDSGATWSTVNTGLNATGVYALAMDASGPDTVYAGAFSILPPGGVFKTTDGGASWTLLPATSGQVPTTLTADPRLPGIIFAGLLGGAVRRSTDGGVTWAVVRSGTFQVTSIVIDPNDSNIVYASTMNGSAKSTDGGLTWSTMSTLTPPFVWGLVVDPTNTSLLYAATKESGIWRSLDAGASWEPISTLSTVPYSFLIDPSAAHTIYVTTSRGVWESADYGFTWHPSGLSDRMAFSITTGPGSMLYAGTTSGAAVSQDLGATWTDPDPGLGGASAFGYAVTVDPNHARKLFVSTLGSTMLASTDKGQTWTPYDQNWSGRESRKINVDPTDSSRVYAGSFYGGGLFKSIDGGVTWSRRAFGSPTVYVWFPVVDPVSPNVVYAGTNGDGLFVSVDYGDSWTVVSGLPPRVVQGVTVDPRNHNDVFAATSAGVYRSLDGGYTWSNVLGQAAWSITLVGGESHVVYAATKRAGVYRSLDDGSTWEAINTGVTNLVLGRAAPVIVDPDDPLVLYVGSEDGGGVYKSIDGGDYWSAVNLGLYDTSVFGLAGDPHRPGTLWVSGPHGVFVTTTGGQ